MSNYLLIKNISVQNANAMSSAFTVGFPAVTAFLGFMHALQRKINELAGFEKIRFSSIGISCNDFKMHSYKGKKDFDYSIIGTANPLKKNGERPSFIEEPRCNFISSLVISCEGVCGSNKDDVISKLVDLLNSKVKLAGGDILKFDNILFMNIASEDEYESKKLLRSLMPGYCLIERKDLVLSSQKDGLDALDGMMDYICLRSRAEKDEKDKVEWVTERKTKGWLVPIAVGFQGISDLLQPGQTLCQRDSGYCHRFAEAIVTLGEFKMPYRFERVEDILWHYEYREKENLYLCVNQKGE